ncbi:MAG: 3,4-dihydroxy-2-butanone-4-phosphate synthase [Alphaproteobacteria bacterium]|nr:3,4-dihydroxy-2-butanone-4-phosphate synthase [Alphaproteobacteria bacterium]
MTKSLNIASKQDIRRATEDLAFLSSVEEIIEDARNGRMFVLVDDEDRENEGDLVIPAQMATPEAINFMAKYGRGLICLALTPDRVAQLGLELMPRSHSSRFETAFTISIEAKEGVTTGISAPDRAHTIAVAIDPNSEAGDIVTPGHIFPLSARDGGVLVRTGHTEAAVDISRLAGLNPSGVICEIMNDDGEMARLPDLISFAQFHGLKIGAINDLIAYRRRHDTLVERVSETDFTSDVGGAFRLIVYRNTVTGGEHIALVKGEITAEEPILARMHAVNIFNDILSDAEAGKGGQLHSAMRKIGEAGSGVIVLIRESAPNTVSSLVRAMSGETPPDGAPSGARELRDYGVGAQILLDLGVKQMRLLSNTEKTIVGLDGYGLSVVGQVSI